MTELAALRRDYAARMLAIAGIADAAVEQALASVRREDFLGAGIWTILTPRQGVTELADHDPRPLYDDVLIQLDPERGVNNGSPSLHALMVHHLGVRPGDRVLHIGAGGGYYTAILAELAGPEGRVTAIEYDARLAEAARANLRPWPGVAVQQGDGADWPQGTVDRIYVNCAVAAPPPCWFDGLTEGGTLVFPLGAPPRRVRGRASRLSGQAAVLACTRVPAGVAVRHMTPCSFVCAEGALAGTTAVQEALDRAFTRGGVEFVRSYRRPPPSSPDRCWFWSPAWALSYDEPAPRDDQTAS